MSTRDEALWMLDASEVRAGQTWRHLKTGSKYTIIATGLDEPTLTPVVVYTGHDGVAWVRALDVFLSDNDEGKPRFVLLENQDHIEQTAPFTKLSRSDLGFEART